MRFTAASSLNAVSGTVIQGYRVASGLAKNSPFQDGTIALQKPEFLERGLDLQGYFSGTLNISIAPKKFQMIAPQYDFKQVKWYETAPAEDFAMSRCYVEFKGKRFEGIVYYPRPETKIRHFHDPSTIEVIAPFIDGITYGASVQLILNFEEVQVFGDNL